MNKLLYILLDGEQTAGGIGSKMRRMMMVEQQPRKTNRRARHSVVNCLANIKGFKDLLQVGLVCDHYCRHHCEIR